MANIQYALLLAVFYPMSLLPLPVLYFLSDALFICAWYIFGYRKKVVYSNLQNAFPDKSDEEIETIARQFYRNLCDMIVEDIKFLSISRKEVIKRCPFTNPDKLIQLFHEGKSVIITLGHRGNWELAGIAASIMLPYQSIAIYRPLSNKGFEKLINRIRSGFGLKLIPQNNLKLMLSELGTKGKIFEFITDQTPVDITTCHWMDFLNQDTPVFLGTEKVAKRTDMPVFYADIKRIKRGYYEIEVQEVCMNPKDAPDFEITEKHTRLLEQSIQEQPDNWLWSHRRWKRKRPVEQLNTATEKV